MTESNTDKPIKASVSIAESHKPTIPQYIVPNRTKIPNLIPPKANEGIRSRAVTNNQEESRRKSSNMK